MKPQLLRIPGLRLSYIVERVFRAIYLPLFALSMIIMFSAIPLYVPVRNLHFPSPYQLLVLTISHESIRQVLRGQV